MVMEEETRCWVKGHCAVRCSISVAVGLSAALCTTFTGREGLLPSSGVGILSKLFLAVQFPLHMAVPTLAQGQLVKATDLAEVQT